jgi:hypothetical protein
MLMRSGMCTKSTVRPMTKTSSKWTRLPLGLVSVASSSVKLWNKNRQCMNKIPQYAMV